LPSGAARNSSSRRWPMRPAGDPALPLPSLPAAAPLAQADELSPPSLLRTKVESYSSRRVMPGTSSKSVSKLRMSLVLECRSKTTW
jgi:hypothetical protein